MRSKKAKGEYGYRSYFKKIKMLQVAFGLLMILVQLAARNFTDNESAKNILTVMAVLSALPTANVASPLLASWKYKTTEERLYQLVSRHEQDYRILYDLIITSKDFIMPADAVVVHPKGVYVYCTSQKVDAGTAEQFLNSMFSGHRLAPHAKVLKEEKAFLQRLETLKAASEYEDDGSVDYTVGLLKNLSM